VTDVTDEPSATEVPVAAPAAAVREPQLDPFAPGFVDDPYPAYRESREGNPVQARPLGPWMLFRHDDCARLLRDPSLSVEAQAASTPVPLVERDDHSMLNLDPPDHDRIRRIVQQVFTPKAVERLVPRVQQLVDTLDRLVDRGEPIDLIAELAFPLPFQVISDMLGMPAADRDRLRDWAHTLTLGLEPAGLLHLEEIAAASKQMEAHVLDAIEWKRAHPADDLLTALVHAEADGGRLSPRELLDQVVLLFVAGHETTVNLIGNGALALLRHRDQLERWQRRPELASNAVDELLRFDSPVQFTRRVTTTDLEVGDARLPSGTALLLVLGSANRDPTRWGNDADALDLARPVAGHLAFGSGTHHCLGAALARLEGRIALGSLVARFPRMELTTGAPTWNGRLVLRGLDELPIALTE
jgi:cytochrome P450